jgi:hypothetical protein
VVDKPVESGWSLEKAEKPPEIAPAVRARAAAQLPSLEAAANRPDTTDPDAVRASIAGISGFLGNLPATGGARAQLIDAATNVKTADITLKTIKHRREMLGVVVSGAGSVISMVNGLAAAATDPPAAEAGQPAPERTALTPAEAAQLKSTVSSGCEFAKRELGKKQPGFALVIGRLMSVRDTLLKFGAPVAVQHTLSRYGGVVDRMVVVVKAISSSEKEVRATARSHLRTAISSLRALEYGPLEDRYRAHFR